jgi:hypothetical protein
MAGWHVPTKDEDRPMTKHIPRKDRWTRHGPNEYRCLFGRVFFQVGQWHAELIYQVADPEALRPGAPQVWESTAKLKRPRNAMIVLEDKVTELQRRHGDHIVFLEPK